MSAEHARKAVAATDAAEPWWRGAVIYQIYPRSFADSNGDGVGDLPGITANLAYVAALGVDAIWLSPFFTSPMNDFGYDVSDYRGVDPVFGTLADFDALVARAHALGIRVIIDQVYAHTSDAHEWFAESRASRANTRADWYVWADPKADGTPPNNWQSVFGGAAWTWDARRQQYYMHNFLSSQPQLNVHLPAVQDALLDVARFWLDRGVDGFRLDALNFAMFDPALRDNPIAAPDLPRTRPFDYQQRIHNQSHPDIPRFIERIRALCDGYGAVFTVAEVGGIGETVDREMKAFTRGDARLSSAYGFDFLYAEALTPALVAETIERWPESEGWPSWAFSNHDAPRAVSRWARANERAAFLRMAMLLLMCLRGNVFLYQGEELGLEQVEIAFDELRDPEAIANWPLTLSRDGARTPMPWRHGQAGAGFTSGNPWLPLGSANQARAVDVQESDLGSLLHLVRRLVALRRASAALRLGAARVITATDALLVFERVADGEHLHCAFNLGRDPVAWEPQGGSAWEPLITVGDRDLATLGGFAAIVMRRRA